MIIKKILKLESVEEAGQMELKKLEYDLTVLGCFVS